MCPMHFPAVLKEWSNAQHMAQQDLAVGENRGELNSGEGDHGEEKNKVVVTSLSSHPWKLAIHPDNSAWACNEQHPQPWQPGTTFGHPWAGISFPSRLLWVCFPTPAPELQTWVWVTHWGARTKPNPNNHECNLFPWNQTQPVLTCGMRSCCPAELTMTTRAVKLKTRQVAIKLSANPQLPALHWFLKSSCKVAAKPGQTLSHTYLCLWISALNAIPSLQLVVKLWILTLGYLQNKNQGERNQYSIPSAALHTPAPKARAGRH